jgi:hypothetical protein
MTGRQTIYDFERVLETSAKAVFTTAEVAAFTSQDTFDFQKNRPRVEILFTPGAGRQQYHVLASGNLVETSWSGTFRVQVVTRADISIHSEFRAEVRGIMHALPWTINEVEPMMHHCLHRIVDGGTSGMEIAPEDDLMKTTLEFQVDFSVQADAWALIA